MKLKNKLFNYEFKGQALENYKKMQCRPAYLRYKRKLCYFSKHNKIGKITPIPFDQFCSIMIAEQKQASLFNN